MAINGMQFQKGLSLAAFLRDYGTEEQCEAAFIKARWPSGFICPRCGHTEAYEFKRQALRYWQCGAYRQPQDGPVRNSSCVQVCKLCPALPGRGSIPL